MDRVIKPELLDELLPDDPEEVHSRRDLRRLNLLMGHLPILERCLASFASARTPAGRFVELGAGDGTFLLKAAKRIRPSWPRAKAVLVDKREIVSPQAKEAFKAIGWSVETITADVFAWLGQGAIRNEDIIVANLFLHHFSDEQLEELFEAVSKTARALIAIEPRRALCPLAFSRMLWFIGCNRVTRHDASISVQAGFNSAELSRLWPAQSGWMLSERRAGLFSHAFVATRIR